MGSKLNLEGLRFSRLVVLHDSKERTKSKQVKWTCICDCGNIVDVIASHLTSGHTRSCGCYQIERVVESSVLDLTGQRFGRLVAVTRTDVLGCTNTYKWICKCDCGQLKEIETSSLRSGNTRSCGCLRSEKFLKLITKHGLCYTKVYFSVKNKERRDRKKAIDFDWTFEMEQFLREFQPICVICGSNDRLATDHVYPISLGYSLKPGNAVRLCISCNSSKNYRFPQELGTYKCYKILLAAESFRNFYYGQSGI